MANESFWQTPPWQGGVAKHRLGLRPVDASLWLNRPATGEVYDNKIMQLQHRYQDVVAVRPSVVALEPLLRDLPLPSRLHSAYPDLIANVAITVSDDLCVLDVDDQQRLVAGCVCAPSYWRLRDKLGKPLHEVHAQVDGMNAKIGDNIERFINRAQIGQPFVRANWFLHGDADLYHADSEGVLDPTVENWVVRVERQSLCKLSARYLLFTIDIACEPLADLQGFAAARTDLETSLARMDADEVSHFGGVEKHRHLTEYVAALASL